MKISRRDILKLAGGSALGFILSPVPYKLLDDSSIWTQSWGPKPLHGESTFRHTACALCPAGCGLRLRCIGSQPVGMAPALSDPLSRGTACPVGLSGHHLAYHPARLMQPTRLTRRNGLLVKSPVRFEDAVATVAKEIGKGGKVGLLDAQPGRAISEVYAKYMEGRGTYITVQGSSSFDVLQKMMKVEDAFGYDIENTKTILSFGAPLLEGWGTPGRIFERVRKNNAPTVIQVETRMSNTAVMADRWLAVKPGTEGALALGLAHVLIGNAWFDRTSVRRADDFTRFEALVQGFTPSFVAGVTGLQESIILETADLIAGGRPALAIGGGNPGGGPLGPETEQAIWALNFLLGSVGTKGGVLKRRQGTTSGQSLRSVPDNSLNVLIIDGAESGSAIPWSAVERKLVKGNNLVLSLSPYAVGMTRHADIVIPSPSFLEMNQDSPTMFDLPFDTFSLSTQILRQPDGVTTPLETIKALAGLTGGLSDDSSSNDDLLRRRVEAIQRRGEGNVYSMKSGETIAVSSPDEFWKQLQEGAVWIGAPGKEFPTPSFSFVEGAERMHELGVQKNTAELVVMPYGWQAVSGNAAVSPILSKLYQESDLFRSGTIGLINPETARRRGLRDGANASVRTPGGKMQLRISLDETVMPGVVHVAVGPGVCDDTIRMPADTILAICGVHDDGSWRVTPVLET